MTDNDATKSIVIERTFDAPASLIWRMWATSKHFQAWYGPTGASIPVAEMDVRVGGKRLVCMAMETPNGPMQMWFTGEYLEIDENVRLVYTESMSDEFGNVLDPADMGMPGPAVTQIIVELEDLDGRTKMTMIHAGVAPDSPGAAGWNMALDKLSDYVNAQV